MMPPKGFLFSAVKSGIKKNKLDLGLIHCSLQAQACGFFTKNKNVSYSVTVSKKHITSPIKAVLVNSGNANCYSHPKGLCDTIEVCDKLAKAIAVNKENILIASTGIIGKKLPHTTIIDALPELKKKLSTDVNDFAACMMTTDTFKKVATRSFGPTKEQATILGFAKGAGMIAPNMATMLVFILTDYAIEKSKLRDLSRNAINKSFNSITIDGCMSTNDTVFVLSSNQVNHTCQGHKAAFEKNLNEVCLELAKMIVKDGEGATKFIEIRIQSAQSQREAQRAGLAIANSNLFKCAIYGANPNWGRIIAALGAHGIRVKENVVIKLSDLSKKNVVVDVDLKRGSHSWTIYTSDLTPQYVKINAEYS